MFNLTTFDEMRVNFGTECDSLRSAYLALKNENAELKQKLKEFEEPIALKTTKCTFHINDEYTPVPLKGVALASLVKAACNLKSEGEEMFEYIVESEGWNVNTEYLEDFAKEFPLHQQIYAANMAKKKEEEQEEEQEDPEKAERIETVVTLMKSKAKHIRNLVKQERAAVKVQDYPTAAEVLAEIAQYHADIKVLRDASTDVPEIRDLVLNFVPISKVKKTKPRVTSPVFDNGNSADLLYRPPSLCYAKSDTPTDLNSNTIPTKDDDDCSETAGSTSEPGKAAAPAELINNPKSRLVIDGDHPTATPAKRSANDIEVVDAQPAKKPNTNTKGRDGKKVNRGAEQAKITLEKNREQDKMDFPLAVLTDYEIWDPSKKSRFKTWCKRQKEQAPDFYFEHIAEKPAGKVAV